MSKPPPSRPGIRWEVGAKVEAQDYLKKWYPARIEKVEPEDGKLLVHFERWSHRFDEWISWDSSRLRPLDRSTIRRDAMEEGGNPALRHAQIRITHSPQTDTEPETTIQELQDGEEVLARWTDCRYYPAKIEAFNKEGTYTVQFYDGVVRSVKRIHIKSMPEDAKGQDWVALVRAATASWSKNINKPRTSNNSIRCRQDAQGEKDGRTRQETEDGRELVTGEAAASVCTSDVNRVMDKHPSDSDPPPSIGKEEQHRHSAGTSTSAPRTLKANKHTREPIISYLQSSACPCSTEDPSQFQCTLPGCSKTFRKAKLLDYHLKYYHCNILGQDQTPHHPPRAKEDAMQAPSTVLPPSPTMCTLELQNGQRRRAKSSCSFQSSQDFQIKAVQPISCSWKRRSCSASHSCDSAELHSTNSSSQLAIVPSHVFSPGDVMLSPLNCPTALGTTLDAGLIKMGKRIKLDGTNHTIGYHSYDDLPLTFLERTSVHHQHGNIYSFLPSSSSKHLLYPLAILQVDLTGENLSEGGTLDGSTTESLPYSSEELDLEDHGPALEMSREREEIVRCICLMEEENGFMIQCEECMCWQHSQCMGLLEDNIPDQYTCHICQAPPGKPPRFHHPPSPCAGQRWRAKYRHNRDWLVKGHMFGLSILAENYSRQNSQQIISTHQLLADLLSLKHILHGLRLKMDILQDHQSPSLQLWARSWVNSDEHQPMGGLPDCLTLLNHAPYPSHPSPRHSSRPCLYTISLYNPSFPDTYITTEHSYQKPVDPPQSSDPAHNSERPCLDLASTTNLQTLSASDTARCGAQQSKEQPAVLFSCPQDLGSLALAGLQTKTRTRAHVQWRMNLLTHIEDVQNQLTSRMDLIEKEVDVLESWLEFAEDFKPPNPSAHLPHLKLSIKQLLSDLNKLQYISTLSFV